MNNKKNILITGGAGFIGANLVHTLLERHKNDWIPGQARDDKGAVDTSNDNGPHIHVLAEPKSDYWRLHDILNSITIHEVNLTNFEQIKKLMLAIKPSIIYHLASFGGFHSQTDQKSIFDVNFYGTVNLLNAVKTVGFDCFVNTGSSSEYGMKEIPMNEDLVLEPISDYGVAKAAATQYCLKEALTSKLPIYTVRPFSVYGDYELHTRLIPTVITHALTKTPIELSAPHFVRDYVYIKDIVDLYLSVAGQRPTSAHVFNGGTGVQSTIQDVINTVQTLCGRPLVTHWGTHTPRPWEPKHWQADTTWSEAVVGWRAQYDLKQGLEASMRWFEQNTHAYSKPKNVTPAKAGAQV